MKNLKIYISVFLILTLVFSLAGCKGSGDVVENDIEETGEETEGSVEPVISDDEDPALYANSDLARENVYSLKSISVTEGDKNSYVVDSGKNDDGVFFIISAYDEYYNHAYYLLKFNDSGDLKETVIMSLPADIQYTENGSTPVSEANQEKKGISYEWPVLLLQDFGIDAEAVNDLYYEYFTYAGDGKYEGILCMSYGDAEGYGSEVYFDVLWDENGECLDIVMLPLSFGYGYVENIVYTDDGSLLVIYYYSGNDANDERAVVYGPDRFKDIKKSIKAEKKSLDECFNTHGSIVCAGEKVVFFSWDYSDDKQYYYELDTETLEPENKTSLEIIGAGNTYITGFTDDDEYIFQLTTGLQVWKKGEKARIFMDYVNSDLATLSINRFVSVKGIDEFYFSYYDKDGAPVFCFAQYVDPESIQPVKVITFGTNMADDVQIRKIVEYNTTHSDYRIVVKDYSIYQTSSDYVAGNKKLYSDMQNGRMPDIVSLVYIDNFDVRSLAENGVLANIGELIENDPSMNLDDFCTNVFEAASIKGNLYQIIPAFSFQTAFGYSEYVDGLTNWTVDDFLDHADEAAANDDLMFNVFTSRSDFLNSIIKYNASSWVDIDRRSCDFNDPSFGRLVAYSMTLPDYIDYEDPRVVDYWENYEDNMHLGDVRLKTYTLYNIPSDYNDNYCECKGRPVYIGMPSPDSMGSCISFNSCIMLSVDSVLLDEAWNFSKYFLSKEYQSSGFYNLPVLRSEFDAQIEAAKKPYSSMGNDGEEHPRTYYLDGEEYTVPGMSNDEAAALSELILSTDKLYFTNSDIIDIILQECDDGYYNNKTPEEIASMIQLRVQDYLDAM